MDTSTTRSIGRGLAALATLLILTVGVPMWLLHVSGSPLPASIPDLGQVWAALTDPDSAKVVPVPRRYPLRLPLWSVSSR